MGFLRAIATDLDGTLTADGDVPSEVMSALAAIRLENIRTLLVTGRTRAELTLAFPGLASAFDAVVAENGAVLATRSGSRRLAPAVDETLRHALTNRGITVGRGEVLLACAADHWPTVAEEIGRLGLDSQMIHNRAALMILPSGISKGTGLREALAEFNLSPHNSIAIGDAENDLALLEVAEIGVAVANAVPSLREHADLVLDEPGGAGTAKFLNGPLVKGARRFCPPRRWLPVGNFDDGQPATLPGGQANLLIAGPSGHGKSYLAGLLVETWVQADYRVLVIDPEGDHSGLAQLRETALVGGEFLPGATAVVDRLEGSSIVLDLSQLPPADKVTYARKVLQAADLSRAVRGVPHWILIEEAQLLIPDSDFTAQLRRLTGRGEVLVTHQPEALPNDVAALIDITLTVPATAPTSGELTTHPPRVFLDYEGRRREFTTSARRTPHTRHRRKYTNNVLQPHQGFYFHASPGEPTRCARNLTEFVGQLGTLDRAALDFHLVRGDFSRWITGTLQDPRLGQHIATIEHDAVTAQALSAEHARRRLTDAVSARYLLTPNLGTDAVIDLTAGTGRRRTDHDATDLDTPPPTSAK